ncbi:hypothetical protein HDV04_002245 [Boothiomyces sp. JEL0838]|nr:hypothetical protein HDV04_002245 [Boothiomyces sp. JEL0838]
MNRLFKNSAKIRSYQSWAWPTSPKPTTPVFMVSPDNGFLPRNDPIAKLPERFDALESLLDRMTLTRDDGTPGLLAKGEFGDAVLKELPVLSVADIEDQELLMALFRDYTFAASSYLLEPCDIMNRSKGQYGLGRQTLPKQIAVPLQQISDKIKAKPFMEYAQSYALYNYKRKNKSEPLYFENLELIRKFSGMQSETGFIGIHVAMVRHTPQFVEGLTKALDSAAKNDRKEFNHNLNAIVDTMKTINGVMEDMWAESHPADYLKFRTFIMGIKGQNEMFPNGVVYEGVDSNPREYRGESGANDSIIPCCDNFLQLTQGMPENPMTEILRDFRSYRPIDHNRFVSWVQQSASELGIEKYCLQDVKSLTLYIALLDQVRDFRHRHWNFAKEYIIKRTAYPKATGGSPMATWLPNQLGVVLKAIEDKSAVLLEKYGSELKDTADAKLIDSIQDRAAAQRRVLEKDVAEYKKKFDQ